MRLSPSSSQRPSPTARTSPFWGFSLAVSGRTIPLAVVSSSSSGWTISRSPRGLSFITREPPLKACLRTAIWHSSTESAKGGSKSSLVRSALQADCCGLSLRGGTRAAERGHQLQLLADEIAQRLRDLPARLQLHA